MAIRDFGDVKSRLEESAAAAPSPAKQHLQTIQDQLEAIQRGDFEAVLQQAHDDATLEIFAPPEFPWVRRATGSAELRAALTQNFGSVTDQRPEVREIFTESDTVILFGRERGVIRQSGLAYDVEFVERFSFRDHRLSAVRIVAAHVEAK